MNDSDSTPPTPAEPFVFPRPLRLAAIAVLAFLEPPLRAVARFADRCHNAAAAAALSRFYARRDRPEAPRP